MTRLSMRALVLVTAMLLSRSAPGAEAGASTLFADGARWCFVGDELTARGSYLAWVSTYLVTRFPGREIRVANAGLVGDTPERALHRLVWDVAPGQPTDVFFVFASPADASLEAKSAGEALGRLLEGGRRLGAVPWMVVAPGVDAEAASAARSAAEAHGATVIDLGEAMARLRGPEAAGTANAPADAPAQLLIACSLLQALGAPSEVATLAIDLRSGRFYATQGQVEKVVRTESDLSFLWTANALPMPFNAAVLPVPERFRMVEAMSREVLQVLGLPAGRWVLHIDGVRIGDYTSERLAEGINLAGELQTPQYRQARDVLRLLETRERLVAENVRSVAFVEHTLAADEPRPLAADRIRGLLAEYQAQAGASGERSAFELYEQRKARESASTAAASRLWVQARRAAQPQPHLYLLKLAR